MAHIEQGRWYNVPRQGQRGFLPTRDHYDLTGQVPPRYLQCEMPNCQDLAHPDPQYRAANTLSMCNYHARLCQRMGAPFPDDIPWADFYRIRDAAAKQLTKVNTTPVMVRALDAVERLPGRCYARAVELEEAGKPVPAYISYGMSLGQRVYAPRFIWHHVAFGILIERGLWKPQPGYPRHTDKAWLRCVHRALTKGQKAERADLGPYQASLFRKLIAADLQVVTGRTDYALREAELSGNAVLPRRDALGWFQNSLT